MIIGEFSKKTGISCSALRYYEEKGLIHSKRDFGNRRIYDDTDIEWVKFLQRLKRTGMSLHEMKKYAQLRYLGDSTLSERFEILINHANYVKEQKEIWEECERNLHEKIDWYKEQLQLQNKTK